MAARKKKAEPLTALLASIASTDELAAAIEGGADIIDLKNPAEGALGAWPCPEIARAVHTISGARVVSATIGDLPMEPESLASTAAAVRAAGADIVKIGMFEGGRRDCIARLSTLARGGARLVAVLFADRGPDLSLIPDLSDAGFYGVMLDTAGKAGGSLTRQADAGVLAAFAAAARRGRLRYGFAGSLDLSDIPALTPLAPDFLGFRRALCGGHARTARLEAGAVADVRAALDAALAARQRAERSKATAAAGAQTPAA